MPSFRVNSALLRKLRSRKYEELGEKLTQLDVANEADVALGTYTAMERGADQTFDISSIEKVANVFGKLANEIIADIERDGLLVFDLGEKLDLRSIVSVNGTDWQNQRLKITVLALKLKNRSIAPAIVRQISLKLLDLANCEFIWASEANIVPKGIPHDDKEANRAIHQINLPSGGEYVRQVQFFNQSRLGMTWDRFHEYLETTESSALRLEATLSSDLGEIHQSVLFSVEEIRSFILEKRRRINDPKAILAFVQPRIIRP